MYCKKTTIEMSLHGCSPEEHAMIPLNCPCLSQPSMMWHHTTNQGLISMCCHLLDGWPRYSQ